jgi:transcription termination factor Rho
MSVLDRASLEQSPLADLHAIASELSIDSYRRLRKEELIDTILKRQDDGPATDEAAEEPPAGRRRRGRRGGRSRGRADDAASDEGSDETDGVDDRGARGEGPTEIEDQLEGAGADTERPQRARKDREQPDQAAEELVEGVIELLPNGSAFMRVQPPEPSDEDIYVSAAQVKRCELVSGDRVSGPRRPPRRSERFASLVRVDMINGRPAAELADSARFEDLPAAFPNEPFRFDSDDPTIKLISERLPIGRGSRVTLVGERQSGKTEALRRLAVALASQEGVDVWLALAGVRPEEISEWRAGPVAPAVAVSLAGSAEAQGQAVEGVIEQARRLAARGTNLVVLVDTLEGLQAPVARRVLAAARNIVDGGSLTVIATAPAALGGETSVIAFDGVRAQARSFPAIDPDASWTMRLELLGPPAE